MKFVYKNGRIFSFEYVIATSNIHDPAGQATPALSEICNKVLHGLIRTSHYPTKKKSDRMYKTKRRCSSWKWGAADRSRSRIRVHEKKLCWVEKPTRRERVFQRRCTSSTGYEVPRRDIGVPLPANLEQQGFLF